MKRNESVSPAMFASLIIHLLQRMRNDNEHMKPKFSYACLIGMALKASDTGVLAVSDIYDYIR